MNRRSVLWLVLTAATAGLVAGCGDNPAGPSDLLVKVKVEIQGPASIAPGQSAQYAVVEHLPNGSTRALPSAAWASSDSSLVQVTSSGVATAHSRFGEVQLSVTTTQSAYKEVVVLPANTFRLVGTVTDTRGAAIPNVRVEVIGGPSATADSNGAYRLYGVPPEADVRVTTDGYKTIEQHMQLTSHTSFNFRMASGVELSGHYTLTLEAGSSCSVPLAADLRRRSYDASVTQHGTRLEVVLTEPRFVNPADTHGRFSGVVTSTGATFHIESWTSGSNLMEQLPDGSVLEIYGTAHTTESSGVLSGSLSGWFTQYRAVGPYLGGACDASRFTLSRR